jgi:hypothetical protein
MLSQWLPDGRVFTVHLAYLAYLWIDLFDRSAAMILAGLVGGGAMSIRM